MRLLMFMQAIDTEDPVHSFMHAWAAAMAPRYECIHLVCLKEGKHEFPANVTVHSLGKECGRSRLKYLWRFYRYAWSLRREYDAVFVHMNPEYVVLGGLLWRLLGKPVFLWRNHYQGGMLTDLAAPVCEKVFYTSKYSYTAKFPNAAQMPVGVDLAAFRPDASPARASRSILSLGRIAPSKRIEVLIDALGILRARRIAFSADIYGSSLPQDEGYLAALQEQARRLGLETVAFHAGPKNADTPVLYASHDVFVNASRSGMYDKTLFEAMASGCIVIASSGDYASYADPRCIFEDGDAAGLARSLEAILSLSAGERSVLAGRLHDVAKQHNLDELARALHSVMEQTLV